jgi:hypothetical protein
MSTWWYFGSTRVFTCGPTNLIDLAKIWFVFKIKFKKQKAKKKKKGQTHLPNKQPKSLGTLELENPSLWAWVGFNYFFCMQGCGWYFFKKNKKSKWHVILNSNFQPLLRWSKNLFSACFHTKIPQKYYENLDKSIANLKTP